MDQDATYKIGICWRVRFEVTADTIALYTTFLFEPLLKIPAVTVYSCNKVRVLK